MTGTLRTLVSATGAAYRALESETKPADEVYADLAATFAAHGLDANTAESAIDWADGGPELLVESLEAALEEAA